MTESKPSGGVTRWPLFAAIALVVAGAAALYFVTRPAPAPAVDPSSGGGLHALSGEGVMSGPDARFTWSRDGRADVYRLEVYDLSSQLLAAAVLRDTSIVASAVLPDTARAGVWRVIPVSPGGTELPGTEPAHFERR